MKPAHIMLRVRTEKRSVTYYSDIFNMQIVDRAEFDDYTLIYLRGEEPGFELELCVHPGDNSDYDMGNGLGHIGFTVEDIDTFRKQVDKKGYEPTKVEDLWRGSELFSRYFFLKDPDGYRIKIRQEIGRFATS